MGNPDRVVKSQQLTSLIAPVVEALGLECLGVEYGQHSSSSLLRIYIDVADRHVTVEDCESVSREVSALMDLNDPISGHYTLEVSSPGFDRPLFTPAHFARFVGESTKLTVTLPIGGRKRFQGPIQRVEGETIVVSQDGVDVAIVHENIEKARLVPNYGPDPAEKPRSPSKAGGAKAAGKAAKKK
jgi:ribosome maturation factor RimP